MDSRLREIHVPRALRVYLATGFDFREKKIVLVLVRSEPGFAFRLLQRRYAMKEG